MTETAWVSERPRLLALGYRMLGSWHDAEDVVQDAWLRWSAADRTGVDSPGAFLTTTGSRLAIDRLRSRRRAQETYVGPWLPEPVASERLPEEFAADADSMSLATLHLMERLSPPERAVFVLREGFAYSFGEIAAILERAEPNARQLFRRARQRIGDQARYRAEPDEHERLLRAVVDAARDGDVADLELVLHEQAVLWSDGGGNVRAALNPVRGANNVARFLAGVHSRLVEAPVVVDVNGMPAVDIGTSPRRLIALRTADGLVEDVLVIANPDKLEFL